MNTAKQQFIGDDYAIYNSDVMEVTPTIPDKSVDLSIYSPPFMGLYHYSSSARDFSNCDSKEDFLLQYEFLVKEIARITKPGRITCVHCTDVMNSKTEVLYDLPHEIIRLHEKYGFDYKNRITVWKEPLKVRMRTMVRSLMHKLIVEDSTQCFTAMPDYVLVFKRHGVNEVPVQHQFGLFDYAGETPLLPAMEKTYGSWDDICKKFKGCKDPKTNKMSHLIWQRYASSVWDDVRINNVLQFQDSKEEDDEKHVHPLQLDVIDRCVELYSNPDEVVFTPFMGVGSEVYSAVSMGRKGIGVELKDSYYKQATINLKDVKARYVNEKKLQQSFDFFSSEEDCTL